MKKSIIYTFALAAGLSLAFACQRPEPEAFSSEVIRIGASLSNEPGTKAFLGAEDLPQNGTKVKIYDDVTGFTGTIDGVDYGPNDAFNYIDDDIVYGTAWSFAKGVDWRWTRTGTHKFYGWLTKDKDGLQNNGTGTDISFNPGTKVLTVPTISFSKNTPQFDFSYSDILEVNVENPAFSAADPINLQLNHLFSALGVSIQNRSNDAVNIVSVSLLGLNAKKSATIDYSVSPVIVNFGNQEGGDPFLASWAEPKPLAPESKIDLVTGGSLSGETSCYLMWPQTASELQGAKFRVVYTIDGVMDPSDSTKLQEYAKEVYLKDTGYFIDGEGNNLGLDAGKRYFINLLFKAKSIVLTVTVLPWDYTEFDLDYSSNSISARSDTENDGVIWLYTIGYDENHNEMAPIAGNRNRIISLASNEKIKGTFHLASPSNGQWQITTYPADAAQYYRVEPSSGEITKDLVEGDRHGLVEFYIYPNGPVPYQQTLHLNLSFRFNGENQWRDGNSEFNRKDWRIVREP